jgi:hypothetical protein
MSLPSSPVKLGPAGVLPELLTSAGVASALERAAATPPASLGSRRHAEAPGSPLHGLSTKVRAGRRARPDSG